MEDPGGREETPPNIELEFRKFDEKDYTSHRNVYVSVHMPYGRKHHHHRHHRHRHHKRKHCSHGGNDVTTLPNVDLTVDQPPSFLVGGDPTTPINPCDRVKFILGEEESMIGRSGSCGSNMASCSSRQLFTEMDELCCYPDNRMEWKETARWIKFEEDLEEDADRWSKPHVATLSLRSLFELRSCVLRGSVQLDLDAENLCQIVDLVLDNLVTNNCLEVEYRSLVREALLQRHCRHSNSHSSGIGLRRSSSQVHHGDDNSPVLSRQTSVTSEMRKNSSFSSLRPIRSLLSSLQLQQQKEEAVPEDAEEGVANRHTKVDQHVMKKLPSNAEASNVLVGEVESLPHTVIAFVRLASSALLGDLTEVPIPTRFIFVLLGPVGNRARYHEVGRSIATLMSDPVFHDVAYKAKCREDLLAGIDEFLDKVTVLPPGEWDPQIRIEPPDNPPSPTTRVATVANVGGESPKTPRSNSVAVKQQAEELVNFQCEKRPFSGLIHDGRRWRSRFLGDIRDALHWNSLAAILLLFFVTMTLAVSLGEELSQLTDDEIGVPESLLASCVGNVLTPLFGGQPLVVMATSKSTLVFDEVLHNFTTSNSIPFLAFRFWVGFWAIFMLLLLVATNASGLLLMLTRFTLELFSVLLSIVFIVSIIHKFWDVHHERIRSDLFYPESDRLDHDCYCYRRPSNVTDNQWELTSAYNCTEDDYEIKWEEECVDDFFISIIFLVGTFLVAFYLRKFYKTPFLTSLIRRIISKFAVPISLIVWVVIHIISDKITAQLPINSEHRLSHDRNLIVNPLGPSDARLPVWAIFAAIIPAIIVTLLVSVQHLVSIHFVNKKLKKKRGYHLDLLVATALVGFSALLGFPWILAALVPSLAHVDILTILSPGKQLPSVREQRITGLVVGLLLAVSVAMEPALDWLPLAVLYGVLLLVGVASFANIQFVQRVALLFITDKHKPDCCYVRNVPNRWIHFFTLLQLLLLVVLCCTALSPAILALPIMVAVIALIRWLLLGFLFSTKHLEFLDDPLMKLRCSQNQRQRPLSIRASQPQPEVSHDCGDAVDDSINISVEMEKCDLWRHVSYTERSPPPTIRVTKPSSLPHQCTAV